MVNIIGFSGGMGCGKSTAVYTLKDYLVKNGHQGRLIKFAGPLYAIQQYIYDTIAPVYTRPASFEKDRKLLQWIGTEWGRDSISKTLWVDLWRVKAADTLKRGLVVVCDDVRFDNEAEMFKTMGGKIVRIIAPNAAERIATTNGIANHQSEQGLDSKYIDATVHNTGTLGAYKEQLENLFKELGPAGLKR